MPVVAARLRPPIDCDDAAAWEAARVAADVWARGLGCDFAGLDLDDAPLLVQRGDGKVRAPTQAERAALCAALKKES